MSIEKPAAICYVEIPAPDIGRAGAFYTDVFGWTVTPSDLTQDAYWMFSTGPGGLSGGLDQRLPSHDGGVLLYVNVEDIPKTLAKVAAAGGVTVREKFALGGGYGFSALFKDPNGNRLGLISKT